MSTLQAQMQAIFHAEVSMAESVARMRERGDEADSIEYWVAQLRALAVARETLRLVLNETEARRALDAHIVIGPASDEEPTP